MDGMNTDKVQHDKLSASFASHDPLSDLGSLDEDDSEESNHSANERCTTPHTLTHPRLYVQLSPRNTTRSDYRSFLPGSKRVPSSSLTVEPASSSLSNSPGFSSGEVSPSSSSPRSWLARYSKWQNVLDEDMNESQVNSSQVLWNTVYGNSQKPPTMSGYLAKYTKETLWHAEAWKKRWFVTEADALVCYANSTERVQKGRIPWCQINDVVPEVSPLHHSAAKEEEGYYIGLVHQRSPSSQQLDDHMTLLRVKKDDDRDRWLYALAYYVPAALARICLDLDDMDEAVMAEFEESWNCDPASSTSSHSDVGYRPKFSFDGLVGTVDCSAMSSPRADSKSASFTNISSPTSPLASESSGTCSSPGVKPPPVVPGATGPRNLSASLANDEEKSQSNRSSKRWGFISGTSKLMDATSSFLREVVSKKKNRYKKDGFDLDLAYISPRIIAMGFPAVGSEAMYRNKREDVTSFLSFYHGDRVRVYNLCAEQDRYYDPSVFNGRVAHYPFRDHNPPPLSMLISIVEDIANWLAADVKNVAAIHCKAGKGRTGCVISAYLCTRGRKEVEPEIQNAAEALKYFGVQRTSNGKGVTIPSQRRYVHYAHILSTRFNFQLPTSAPVEFVSLSFSHFPFSTGSSFAVSIDCPEEHLMMYTIPIENGCTVMDLGTHTQTMQAPPLYIVDRDTNIEVFSTHPVRRRLFSFWVHSFFLFEKIRSSGRDGTLSLELSKQELDGLNKDSSHRLAPREFRVQLVVKATKKSYASRPRSFLSDRL